MNLTPEGQVERLKNIIADAIKAMDEGRMGDVRRILRTGNDSAVMARTGVIARDGDAPG